jgi:kynurenine formamidase
MGPTAPASLTRATDDTWLRLARLEHATASVPLPCVQLLTGYAPRYYRGNGADSPYVTTNAPGFAGEAVDWLFNVRSILATGSDTLGPDATIDETLRATTRTLLHGGITVSGNRPAFSGFQMGFTGFTLASHCSMDADSAARA